MDKLLSTDGKLTLFVLALDPSVMSENKLPGVIGEVRKTVNQYVAGTGLRGELSGVPVMQLEIRNAIQRDRLVYNTLGFIAGCLIAILFFRRISFMFIAAAPPLAAILLALGALGWLDFRLNMFLNVMTPLIMVISFSDSMQLTFAARDRLLAGDDKYDGFPQRPVDRGPACVLTHATAGISFIALQFSQSDLIRTFGEAGLIATVIAMVAVFMVVPVLGVLLIRNEAGFVSSVRGMDTALDVLRRLCGWVAIRMVTRPGLYSLIGLIVVVVLSLGYLHLQPRYRLADQVPDREQAVEASNRLDIKLTGANPVDVLIEFPKGKSLYEPETLAVIAEVHSASKTSPASAMSGRWRRCGGGLAEKARRTDVATLKQYVDMLPKYLTRRFVSAKQDAIVVSGRVPGRRRQQAAADCRRARRQISRRAREISRLQYRRHGTVGDRRAQQRADDRQTKPRLDHRNRLRRRLHRARVPLAGGDAGISILPGIFPDRAGRLAVMADRVRACNLPA